MKIGQFAQAAALERAIERRQGDLAEATGFARKVERNVIRHSRALDRLEARLGLEPHPIRPVLLAGLKELRDQIEQRLPRSQRALLRLTRPEAKAVLRFIERVVRRQRRLQTLIVKEQTWRRQIMKRLRATDAVLPLINDGHLDRLEVLLARRRGKGGVNKSARMLGILRATTHPYSLQHMSKLGRAGAARRWARAKGENDANHERDAGTTGATGGAG
jgi:hypothetical protein